MKQCPNCGAKNRDAAIFCEHCGNKIIDVPIVADGSKDFFNKAAAILSDGVKLAKDTVVVGAEKARKVIETERAKTQVKSPSDTRSPGFISLTQSKQRQPSDGWDDATQAASPQNTNWDAAANPNDAASVTRKQYPFFRDEEEETIAVIGEQAAFADLEGSYEKPYAILTPKCLYCKNEAGNFVMDVSQIQSVGENPIKVKTWALIVASVWNLLFAILLPGTAFAEGGAEKEFSLCLLLFAVSGIVTCAAILFHCRKELVKAANALCIGSIANFLGILSLLLVFAMY